MDNQQTENNDVSPQVASGQVMDVTAPSQQIDVSDLSTEASAKAEASSEATPVTESTSNVVDPPALAVPEQPATVAESSAPPAFEPTPEPAAPTSINVTEAASAAGSDAEPAADATAPSTEPTEGAPSSPSDSPLLHAAAPGHAKKPPIAIIVAILIALAIAGVAVFTYMKSKNNDTIKRSDTTASTDQTVVDKPQASASDVDATNKSIDDNLKKTDDTKDFPSTDLTDTTLGL